SSVVAERNDTNEEPAVLAVTSPEPRLGLPRKGAGKSASPSRQERLDVLGMNEMPSQSLGLRIPHVFARQTVGVQQYVMAVAVPPGGWGDGDVMRHQIDQESNVALRLLQFRIEAGILQRERCLRSPRSVNNSIRAGVKTPRARLFSRYSTPTSAACFTNGRQRIRRARRSRTYGSATNGFSAAASSRITLCRVRGT